MEAVEYEVMFHREEDYWWYVGLRDLVLAQIARFARNRKTLTMLDAGCGTGKLLEACRNYLPYGLEYSQVALPFLQRRGVDDKVVRASICHIPFPDDSFDLVTSMDVLYTVPAPGDFQGLREMARVLKPGGLILLNLPAYEFLRSHHDAAIHTRQRYTRGTVRDMLKKAGLQATGISYRNTVLFPLVALVRGTQKLLKPNPEAPKSDLRPLPRLVNRALLLPLLVENRLIRAGVRLPFGLSIFCAATKA
jgi:ubiquinone/menaquinone biosynthesis C-methylase UbiE